MKDKKRRRDGNAPRLAKKLSTVFRRKLLKVSAIILLASILLIVIAVLSVVHISTSALLDTQIGEMTNEMKYYSDTMFSNGNVLSEPLNKMSDKELAEIMATYGASNWYYVDKNGVVVRTDNKSKLGVNAFEDPDLCVCCKELIAASDDNSYVETVSPEAFRSGNWKKRSGFSMGDGSCFIFEFAPEVYYGILNTMITGICNYNSVGSDGWDIVIDQSGDIISPSEDIRESWNFQASSINVKELLSLAKEKSLFSYTVEGTAYYTEYAQADGYYVITLIPVAEVMGNIQLILLITAALVILLLTVIFLRINVLMNRLVVKNINTINSELSQITDGNLNTEIDVKNNLEFKQLSDGINTTVSALKGYIERDSERFERELELARDIQTSALPNVFPPFPDRHDIDIFASMKPAKQVGGDFYDFFFTDDAHLVFLTADVSDKGIPAAMFMMKAKTIIKNLAQSNRDLETVIAKANNILCEDNSADMFVTLWIAMLNTETGELTYVNAGHCKPLLKSSGGRFEYLTDSPDFIVAGEEDIPYHNKTITLNKGDALFLYTDGVTEAVNTEDTFFGEDRLKAALNRADCSTAGSICSGVNAELSAFAENAHQSDDITMLAVIYHGRRVFDEITVDAKRDQLDKVYRFVDRQLAACEFGQNDIAQFGIITDEICANIIRYAYPDGGGSLTAGFAFDPASDEVTLTFTDNGKPFNPLNAPEPDIKNVEDRKEGGMGIFLVRKFSDKLQYEYSGGKNILTITKKRLSKTGK